MSNYEKQARNLVNRSKEMKLKVSYQQGLELIASINGFNSWAALKKESDKIQKEEVIVSKDNFVYARLDYFYSRKDSGSFFLKLDPKKFPYEDNDIYFDDNCIQLAIREKMIDESDADSITVVEKIDLEDYLHAMGKDFKEVTNSNITVNYERPIDLTNLTIVKSYYSSIKKSTQESYDELKEDLDSIAKLKVKDPDNKNLDDIEEFLFARFLVLKKFLKLKK